ncbi:helicase SEN1 isoform X3 [Capsicum annuum]|uniref:helicase SEN1 isoform X3 n=1 Tax=Capsicum annuum TaxID=4072 RepID=UPI001FB095FD|nr:helicase SEN1 isoform X3 [Capsicum annuum]
MSKTRRELLERWRVIEEEDEENEDDGHRFRQLKEEWFSDAFNYLISLPQQSHIWCASWDLMGPLLETFYNYYKDHRTDSPLKLLMERTSEEMRHCTQCICQYHQAQELYTTEYDPTTIGPLLDVLRTLDEERITQHLKHINNRITCREHDIVHDSGEIVSVMFEVLMFPILLDDSYLASEFETFIDAIDKTHELTLGGHQQYPGVYALLFHKGRRARTIGLRLAGRMGKLRLGFLEPPAFEEGILDRYPIFLSVVLNHISDDSPEFSCAVNCLRLLFEMLGYKLWLKTSLSPSVMRNTLLGQCFHTRNEKSHKEIFDLFQPFLQSLEALQDGEHEKQRRNLLYFLLHQVTVSSNFSLIMRKKACQIALFIVHRGYTMNPPSPPYECAHMWGPSLVSSLKDSSLHSSLRQPAFDVIQTIIVSDASALITSILKYQLATSAERCLPFQLDEEEGQGNMFGCDFEENDVSCWNEFSSQADITSDLCGDWMCIPMLWFEILVEIDPSILPISFAKAVFWALSRLSLLESDNDSDMTPSVGHWLRTCGSDISHVFNWKVPSGSNDGGEGVESKNSIKVSTKCIPLIRLFKRSTAHFIIRMEQGELRKQWTWEPMISDSLILLLVDPNDNARHVGRCILEQLSNTRGLTSGLQFLCSSPSSLVATFTGIRHALKLVQLDCVLSEFQTLHHFFFVMCKLIKEGNSCSQPLVGKSCEDVGISKFSSQGGFLKQPVLQAQNEHMDAHNAVVSSILWEKFCCLLSEMAWISVQKCLAAGKVFIGQKSSQMTCIRLLETLPVVFGRLCREPTAVLNNAVTQCLRDLIDWGHSPLPVVVRYWKDALISLLILIKESCCGVPASLAADFEKLISCDNIPMNEMTKQVAQLSVSLVDGSYTDLKKTNVDSKCLPGEEFILADNSAKPFSRMGKRMHVPDSKRFVDKEISNLIVHSGDDRETDASVGADINSCVNFDPKLVGHIAGKVVYSDPVKEIDSRKISQPVDLCLDLDIPRFELNAVQAGKDSPLVNSKAMEPKSEETDIKCRLNYLNLNSKENSSLTSELHSSLGSSSYGGASTKENDGEWVIKTNDAVLKELVSENRGDQESAFLVSARRQRSFSIKTSLSGPKRKVIQLSLPVENRSNALRLDDGVKRFKTVRLDDWYRPILEFNYFSTVGLTSAGEGNNDSLSKLKEVPVCFQSVDEYVEIFRPLILEEFKAQLQSSFQEMTSPEEMSCGSLSVMSVERIDDFHFIRCVHEDVDSSGSKSCSDNDLILLTRQPLRNSCPDIHMVGKVEKREKDCKRRSSILLIRLYLQNKPYLMRARKFLVERSKWCISRLMTITSQLREFQALSGIRGIPLLPVILNPTCYDHYKHHGESFNKLSRPLQQVLKSAYNDSQLQAISSAIGPFDPKKDFQLSLIQGPPGTGKTRVIVAIVSSLLSFAQVDGKRSSNGGLKSTGVSGTASRQRVCQAAAVARAWQDAALARQLNDDLENDKLMGNCSKRRILICAQSNAAVDELVSRITSEGLYGSDGTMYKPYIVRVGNTKTVHPNSLPFFIDTLVDHRIAEEKMNATDSKNDADEDTLTCLRSNLEKLVDTIKCYEAKRASLRDGNSDSNCLLEGDTDKANNAREMSDAEVEAKLRILYEKKKSIYMDLAAAQARERKANEETKALRHKLRKAILKEAEIVVTTLSGCGGDLYGVCAASMSGQRFSSSSEGVLFDAVVIDEAAQALEPASLIPLQLLKSKGTRCVMVGDPKQLPATVLSNIASKFSFQCSMFERLQRAGYPVNMLTQQYRMHPDICRFPSFHFYDGKLVDGDQLSSKVASFHGTKALGPYVFFDVVDGKELHDKKSGTLSLYNESEADAAVEVLRFFKRRFPSEFVGGRIGIITPYRCQLSLLRSRFSSAFGSSITADMEFNTVDGFQGREVDIVILSTVRAFEACSNATQVNSSRIGFVADVRRMNVALTRAKLSLWIMGNTRTLRTNQNWAALVKDAKERELVMSLKRPYNATFKSYDQEKHFTLEKPENCTRKLKHVKAAEATCEHGDRQKKNVKHVTERKRKDTSFGAPFDTPIRVDLYGKNVEGVQRSKDESSLLLKKDLNNYDGRNSKSARILLGENQPESSESCEKISKKHGKERKAHGLHGKQCDSLDSNLGNSKKSGSDYHKHSVSVASERFQVPSERDDKLQNTRGWKNPAKTTVMQKNVEAEVEACNQVKKPDHMISERKQQRDAVDALLSSALISSNKSRSSLRSLPAKRTSSPNAGGPPIRPPKKNKLRLKGSLGGSFLPHHPSLFLCLLCTQQLCQAKL